jgi:hypothetical protein
MQPTPTNEQPTIEALTADRDLWRARYLAAHEVIAAVEQLVDMGIAQAMVSKHDEIVKVRGAQLHDVIMQFEAWRQLIEGDVPARWVVAQ